MMDEGTEVGIGIEVLTSTRHAEETRFDVTGRDMTQYDGTRRVALSLSLTTYSSSFLNEVR